MRTKKSRKPRLASKQKKKGSDKEKLPNSKARPLKCSCRYSWKRRDGKSGRSLINDSRDLTQSDRCAKLGSVRYSSNINDKKRLK